MSTSSAEKSEATRAALRKLRKVFLFLPLFVAAMFLMAGRLDWLMGWVYVGVFFVAAPAASCLFLLPKHPDLIVERLTKRKPVTAFDKALYPFLSIFALAIYVVPCLDVRFGWSPPLPLGVQLGALAVAVATYGLVFWAMWANRFFSKVVYIQKERGHAVATEGPYRFIRHPGYTAIILFMLAMPVSLGSVWGLLPAGIEAVLIIVRTVFEDRFLHDELEGYPAYAQRVRYRLLPGVW